MIEGGASLRGKPVTGVNTLTRVPISASLGTDAALATPISASYEMKRKSGWPKILTDFQNFELNMYEILNVS